MTTGRLASWTRDGKVVSERLGHAQISLTLDIYAHVLPAMDADAADKFAAAVFDP